MDVIINGQSYSPSVSAGIALSSFNRQKVLTETLGHLQKHCPTWMPIVVVDDASTTPLIVPPGVTLIRHDENLGIAATKNRCIAELMDLGVEHLFLLDDDIYPTADDWWRRYVEHPEPHLMYLFKNPEGPPDWPPTLYDDGTLFAYTHSRGCLLYIHRTVIDQVGGMRQDFGKWGWEHVEYSMRVHAAGLTSFEFADIHGDNLYSMDEHLFNAASFQRSVPKGQRDTDLKAGEELMWKIRGSTDFVPYRDEPNLVITTLLTTNPDPQRTSPMKADPALLADWKNSLKGATPVILSDSLEGDHICPVSVGMANPYFQRWFLVYQYLREHPAKWVWVTDGTDVKMLHEPWDDMEPATLYIGYEPKVVGDPWMSDHHETHRAWLKEHRNETLLNGGVVGGDHATMLAYAHAICREIISSQVTIVGSNVGDMAVVNKVAYEQFTPRTGPGVVTLFKKNETNDWSWFMHK